MAADRGLVGLRVALAAGAVALAAACATRRRAWRAALALGVAAAAGAAALAVRLETVARERPTTPTEALVEGRAIGVDRFPSGVRVDLVSVAEATGRGPVPRRVRLHARWRPGESAAPLAHALRGDRLRVQVRLRAPRSPANPGGTDRTQGLARRGIAAVGTPSHPALVVRRHDPSPWPSLQGLEAWRRRSAERLAERGAGGALLAALALGERGGLSETLRRAFGRLGLAHLLAVSGLHVALVAALAFGLVHRMLLRIPTLAVRCDPRRGALLAALLAAFGYALLAGWGVPVRRALVLLLGFALALAVRRPVRPGNVLAAAALLVLAAEPAALFEPGAQMSFAACGALLLASRRRVEREGLPGPGRRIADGVHTTATALLATAPVAAAQLGLLAPTALVTNLVLVPVTGAVLLPLALLGAALAGVGATLPLAACVVPAAVTVRAIEAVASQAPELAVARPAAATLLAALALAVAALRSRTTALRAGAALAQAALLLLAPPAGVAPPPPRAVFLDVGQGDASLVQGRQAAVLVDAGTALPDGPDLGHRVVVPALRALGVGRLDLLVVSHADLDHRGGVASVLRALAVDEVWVPPQASASPALGELLQAARVAGAVVHERSARDGPWRRGDLRVTPLWPPPGASGLSRNDRSLVVRVDVAGGRRVLLPGDLEAAGEAALVAHARAALCADVLKLAHHGSRTSSGAGFLQAVGGRLAIASAPFQGRFEMPHESVRERVRRAGYVLGWTGRDGAVLVGLAERLVLRTWRAAALTPGPPRPPCAAPRTPGPGPRSGRADPASGPSPS